MVTVEGHSFFVQEYVSSVSGTSATNKSIDHLAEEEGAVLGGPRVKLTCTGKSLKDVTASGQAGLKGVNLVGKVGSIVQTVSPFGSCSKALSGTSLRNASTKFTNLVGLAGIACSQPRSTTSAASHGRHCDNPANFQSNFCSKVRILKDHVAKVGKEVYTRFNASQFLLTSSLLSTGGPELHRQSVNSICVVLDASQRLSINIKFIHSQGGALVACTHSLDELLSGEVFTRQVDGGGGSNSFLRLSHEVLSVGSHTELTKGQDASHTT